MKLTAFLSCAFLAASIGAAALPAPGVERSVRRGPSSARRQLSKDHTRTTGIDAVPTAVSPNWAGAALTSPPEGETFTSVTGAFTVPVAGAPGTDVAVWLGIDGFNHEPPLIQGGIDCFVDYDGTVYFESWTEWYPDPAVFYDQTEFSFQSGDKITVTITTQAGSTDATMVIENNTSGASITKMFSPSDPSMAAQGMSAEWVVERTPNNSLSDFGTITFTEATAATANTQLDLSGATALEIQIDGKYGSITIATSSITDANTDVVTYVGN